MFEKCTMWGNRWLEIAPIFNSIVEICFVHSNSTSSSAKITPPHRISKPSTRRTISACLCRRRRRRHFRQHQFRHRCRRRRPGGRPALVRPRARNCTRSGSHSGDRSGTFSDGRTGTAGSSTSDGNGTWPAASSSRWTCSWSRAQRATLYDESVAQSKRNRY